MGCCGTSKKKAKSQTDVIKNNKKSKIEKKINDIDKKAKPAVPSEEEIQPLKTEAITQQEPTPLAETPLTVEKQTKSPSISSPSYNIDDFIKNLSPTDNISPVQTWHDLEKFVEKNDKSVSIVLFYARYCPYSKRTLPSLRQWARANQDRIFLYEADVEQALNLAEYYHVRSIPTIMAFEEKNLLAPIWQRTASNVLPATPNDESQMTDEEQSDNELYAALDSSFPTSNSIQSSKDTKAEQNELTLDQMPNSEEEEDRTIDQSHSLAHVPSKSTTSSPYIWNQSTQSLETTTEKSLLEYHGRMTSQSTLASKDQWKKDKQRWNEYFEEMSKTIKEYPQHIHLPNNNEIFYEKSFDPLNPSLSSSDRFSTLTYQQVQELNHPHDEICVLYLGPNGTRGFEDNLVDNYPHPSKSSLLTLQSNINH